MPATVNSTVGSCGMRLADGTTLCPFAAKKSEKARRSSLAVRGGCGMEPRAYRWAVVTSGAAPGLDSLRGLPSPERQRTRPVVAFVVAFAALLVAGGVGLAGAP